MVAPDAVAKARAAFERMAWNDAYVQLSAIADLEAADVERLAVAAYLTGRVDPAAEAFERAHLAYLDAADTARAVRIAFLHGMMLMQRNEHARGGGWLGRAAHLLDDASLDCVERGYLMIPRALQALEVAGDPATAYATFAHAGKIADRFGDPDLAAMSSLGRGQALVTMGDTARGVPLLDEAMVSVTAGEVSPIFAGIIYCAVIIACWEIFDLRRAQEWTAALGRWCAAQQGLKPYRGQCLVHRSEIMRLRGEWADAMDEVQAACEHLSDPPGDPVLGMALYQQAELLRLRGEFDRAEDAYRKAGEFGHPVHPGLALLRLAQGRTDDAQAAIRRVHAEAEDNQILRAKVLAAYVEVMLETGDAAAARAAADELEMVAEKFDSAYLRAVAGYSLGAVLLAEGDPTIACTVLRRAWTSWQRLEAPYDAAKVRLLIARACHQLSDHDTAAMELDAARRAFEYLGAKPALDHMRELSAAPFPSAPGGLTQRELEVLRLVARGSTNRDIADTLVISEHTARRHLQNIFAKIGVSSRAAATAFAYERDLI